MPTRERIFTTELGHSFRERGAFFHKIMDMPHFQGAQFRFDIKKPFDVFACYLGIPIAIECKSITKFQKFGIKNLRPNQVIGLEAFSNAGGSAFVFLNVRRRASIDDAISHTNRLYIFEWKELRAKEAYSKAELLTLPHIVGRKQRFNLDEFLVDLFLKV